MIFVIFGVLAIFFGTFMILQVNEKNAKKYIKLKPEQAITLQIKKLKIYGLVTILLGIVLIVITLFS